MTTLAHNMSAGYNYCSIEYTEIFGSTGFGNNGFSGVTDKMAIPN